MGISDYYSHGNWDVICDDCGRKYKATDLLKRWDGLMVCKQYCFEERHPQDFVRGATDKISVPWSRPENQDQFITGFCDPVGSSSIADLATADCAICDAPFPVWFAENIQSTFTP